MSWHRHVAWVEREDKIYLAVMFVDAKDKKVNIDPEGIFTLSGSTGVANNGYELKLELFDKVDVEKSVVDVGGNGPNDIVFCVLMKAEKKWWNKLLHGDEDDEEAPNDGMDEIFRTWPLRMMAFSLLVLAHVNEMNGIYRTSVSWVMFLASGVVILLFRMGSLAIWVLLMAIRGGFWWVLVLLQARRAAHVVARWFFTLQLSVKRMGKGFLVLNVVGRMRC